MNLEERIQDGINGKFKGLANGFHRLNEIIFGIQRGTYYLLGGQSGTFKTTLCDYMILNAITDALQKGITLNVFYYSYEIDKITKQCNWLSVMAYQKYGVIIAPETIKGLGEFRLTKDEHKIINDCIPDVELLFSRINFEFVPSNPTGIYNQCFKFLETRGTIERKPYIDHEGNEKHKIVKYIPNDPNEITIGVLDHLYCLKKERGYAVKETIDKHSEYCVQLRNLFGMSWLNIQQFNRAMSSIDRIKFKGADMSPQESDFKDTGNTYSDADIVLGTMSPFKLDMERCMGYDITKLQKQMVMLKVIKNRLSKDDILIGLHVNPKAGSFSELPKPNEIDYTKYN